MLQEKDGDMTNNEIDYNKPTVHNYYTGEIVRNATNDELNQSIDASKYDGGCGVITINDQDCYVME